MPKKEQVQEIIKEAVPQEQTLQEAEAIELDPPQVRVFTINPDQSYIRGGRVFVHVTEFETIADRDRHQSRHPIMHLMAASVHEAIAHDPTLMDTLYPLVNRILLQEQMPSSLPEFEGLVPFGFDPTWITHPVRTLGQHTIEAGEFDPQPITREFLINQLECRLGKSLCDCR